MKWIKNISAILLVGVISLILYLFGIRVCPTYNLFGIPCPGCGLTRAIIELLQLNFKEALEYNFLSYVLLIIGVVYIMIVIFHRVDKMNAFVEKNKKIIIILSVILMIISFYININNPLLY